MQNCYETKMNKYIPISCNNMNLNSIQTGKMKTKYTLISRNNAIAVQYKNINNKIRYITLIELGQVKQATCLLI